VSFYFSVIGWIHNGALYHIMIQSASLVFFWWELDKLFIHPDNQFVMSFINQEQSKINLL